jgi:hypothetical protein
MRWRWLELAEEEKPWHGLEFDIPEEAKALFKAAAMCVLGDGAKLKFWTDRWLGGCSIAELAPNLMKFVRPARRNNSVGGTHEVSMDTLHQWDAVYAGDRRVHGHLGTVKRGTTHPSKARG